MTQKALNFDGIDDYCQRDAVSPITNAWSVEFWFDPDVVNNQDYLFRLRPSVGDANEIRVIMDYGGSGKIRAYCFDSTGIGGGYKNYMGNTALNIDAGWYYIVITWDGTNLKIYLNGSEDTPYTKTVDGSPTMTNTSRRLNIGSYWDGGQPADGIIDEVRLSNIVRTAEEILATWNNGKGKKFEVDANTVGLWHLDEGADAIAYDETDNSYDLTIDGASWIDGFPFGVVVTPATLALTLAFYAPTVLTPRLVTPSTLALSLTAYAPSVTIGTLVTPTTLALSLTTHIPTILTPRLVTPSTLALTLTEYAPSAIIGFKVTPSTLALVLLLYAPSVNITGLMRHVFVITSQYRDVKAIPSQYRQISTITSQHRKVKILTSGG